MVPIFSRNPAWRFSINWEDDALKRCVRKLLWPICRHYSSIKIERIMESTKDFRTNRAGNLPNASTVPGSPRYLVLFSETRLLYFYWSLMCCSVYVKIKLPLWFFNRAPRHEDILGEWRYSSTQFLTSALDEGEWSASLPDRFTSKERDLGTHWIGVSVGPTVGLNTVSKRKIPSPRWASNPRSSSP